MQVKRELNTDEVERIRGSASQELTDRCPDRLVVFPLSPCTNVGCGYSIREPGYMNCSFVAAETGEHTLEAIGEMMGITRAGAHVIQMRAMKKLRALLKQEKKTAHEATTRHKPDDSAGRGDVVPVSKVHKRKNKRNLLPVVDGRELGECSG